MHPTFTIGSTAWYAKDNRCQLAIIVEGPISEGGDHSYFIRPLNRTEQHTVAAAEIKHVNPEPADLPITSDDVDSELVTNCLSPAELSAL